MKKKDARILWNNENGRMANYTIVECTEENDYRRDLDRIYLLSYGNCNIEWKDLKAIDVILYFSVDGFVSRQCAYNFFDDLTKIEEFQEEMSTWIKNMPKD